jgi:Protein of unknown function (DUF3703)
MNGYYDLTREWLKNEIAAARKAEASGDFEEAFRRLERAHVVGQRSTRHHVHIHWEMFKWALRRSDLREMAGQVTRLIGAAVVTAWGWIPIGNTGGSNISPFKPMPIPDDLATIIMEATRR